MNALKDTWSGLATLVRPTYAPGLLLEDEDLTAAVDYTRELNRLLFRSLFGCGVICGLTIKATPECNGRHLKVVVAPGLALDCMGNPIHVPGPVEALLDPDCKAFPEKLWVLACYRDAPCRPRDLASTCDDGYGASGSAQTRRRDGFEIKLSWTQPDCACSCEPPRPQDQPSHPGRCCGEEGQTATARTTTPAKADKPRDCYADHMEGICACDCGCNCVLIGILDLDRTDNNGTVEKAEPDYSAVRRIRPLLVGQAPWFPGLSKGEAYEAAAVDPAAEETPAAEATGDVVVPDTPPDRGGRVRGQGGGGRARGGGPANEPPADPA